MTELLQDITWTQAERVLIPAQLLLAMLGMGATLSLHEFKNVIRHPAGVSMGLGLQWLAVPLWGQLLIWAFSLSPGWAAGIILVTVTPGGAFSNLLTYLGRGHLALSISVTAVATVASTVTAPLLLRLLASSFLPADFSFPTGRILLEVTLYLLIPLFAGIAIYTYLRRHAKTISKAAIWASMTLVLIIAAGALTAGRIKVAAHGWGPPMWTLLFAVGIHFASLEVCRLLRRTDDESVALAIEVSVRNGGVGLLLMQFFFPGQVEQDQALYTILFYTGLQVWIPVPAILLHRWGKSPLLFRKARPGEEHQTD